MHDNPELARRIKARIGSTLSGKYRIDALLGVGGMAAVYHATHRNQAEFAIKVLHPDLSFNEDVRTRFLREGYAANSVKHAGVVRVVDDDIAEDGAAFLVMELLRGSVVQDLCDQRGGRLPVPAAVAIADQLLDVLASAHVKGIIHRDIKPANLFVTTEGAVKVLDFGIARAKEIVNGGVVSGQTTGTGIVLGTPAFMAPEQALAKGREIDEQTDLWAAGATLFTMLSGEFVHEGENLPQLLVNAATSPARPLLRVVPDVPPEIAMVVDRGVAFDKAARWRSAGEMRQALAAACRAAYGELPSPALLAPLAAAAAAKAAAEPTAKNPTPTMTAHGLGSGHGSWPASRTTGRPVSSQFPAQSTPPFKRSKAGPIALAVAGTVVSLVCAGLVVRSIVAGASGKLPPASSGSAAAVIRPTEPPPSPAAAGAPGALQALPQPVAAPPVDDTPPTASADEPSAAPGSTPRGATTAPPWRGSGGHSAAPARTGAPAVGTAPAARAKVDCDPPFTINSAGHRVPKPECL
jgi:serine/threonine-protein kinase